jgi:hypothetical protein
LNWLKSSRLTYELELEPKVLVAAPEGEPGWATFDVTPNAIALTQEGGAEAARPTIV